MHPCYDQRYNSQKYVGGKSTEIGIDWFEMFWVVELVEYCNEFKYEES